MLCVIGEATNTNFIVFGFTWPGLEPTIYNTLDEHANHYTTNVVLLQCKENVHLLYIYQNKLFYCIYNWLTLKPPFQNIIWFKNKQLVKFW
jgi:hypothetical protein